MCVWLHISQGEQQRPSFHVVVWSLGVSSAPWQRTPSYGYKIRLFWRDGPGRKRELCKCRPNSTLASNSPSSLCTHCETGTLLTERAGWRSGISRGEKHTHTHTRSHARAHSHTHSLARTHAHTHERG